MEDIVSPEGFFDDFENAIKSIYDDVKILDASELASYELAGFKFKNGVIRVSIKYGGITTPEGYTLEMKWGSQGPPLKFRFL